MAYEEALADDVRARLAERSGITEREMFGGIAFMLHGNMAVGVAGSELMVRVGKEDHDEAMALPGTREFDMTGRAMKGWILVGPEGYATDADFQAWVDRGVAFAASLPAK